jgi:uronate dehydrogenase
MARVTITGAAGTIGTVLMNGLGGHKLTGLDLPGCDLRHADLRRAFRRRDVVVHLAWNSTIDNAEQHSFDPDNATMTYRVYEAAVAAGVQRVVMASSVHADRYASWAGHGMLAPDAVPWPDSPYGAGKVMMESLGRYYAVHRGLEVVCIRFGGVSRIDDWPEDPDLRSTWLRHDDCVEVVRRTIEVGEVPGRFAVMYAVSENAHPVVDVANPIGWRPHRRG